MDRRKRIEFADVATMELKHGMILSVNEYTLIPGR